MNQANRSISIACLALGLYGCAFEEGDDANANISTNDQPSISSESTTVLNDGLNPPVAPALTIASAPGTLRFSWVDEVTPATSITEITLYEHNSRSGLETPVETTIANDDVAVDLPIAPHQLAWDTLSYRIEICTSTDCLSSLRVPVSELLNSAFNVIQPTDSDLLPSFGSALAINATGNVALAANPQVGNVSIHFNNSGDWIFAGTLMPSDSELNDTDVIRIAASDSGDTIAIATMATNNPPTVAIFDRLGETWLETSSIEPFISNNVSIANTANNRVENWNIDSLQLVLSADGNRLAIGAQQEPNVQTSVDLVNNSINVFDRGSTKWESTANLFVPALHQRLYSFSANSALNTISALSTTGGSLFLFEYQLNGAQWSGTLNQRLDNILPTLDTKVVSSAIGDAVAIASWEVDSLSQQTPVAWRLARSNSGWIGVDSVRLTAVTDTSAQLRLAADGELNSMAIGWQAQSVASSAFYSQESSLWEKLFDIPRALSLAISKDNSVALVGASGGFIAFATSD